MLVKRHSGFLALGFLIGVDDLEDIVLTLVNPSGVKTMVASRISFNCCWLSQLPSYLYNFLMFQDICVQIEHCFLRIGKYQWSVHDILDMMITTYL